MSNRRKTSRKVLSGVLGTHDLSIGEFAEKHGFKENTVRVILHRHWGKDTNPQGELTLKILREIEQYFDKPPAFKASAPTDSEARA